MQATMQATKQAIVEVIVEVIVEKDYKRWLAKAPISDLEQYTDQLSKHCNYLKGVLQVYGPAGQGLVGIMNLDKDVVPRSTAGCCTLGELQGYFWEEHRVDIFGCQGHAINTICIDAWAKVKATEPFLDLW